MRWLCRNNGFTLIEIAIIIIIIGILASVAMRKMSTGLDTARYEQTKKELDELAISIVGNPHLSSNGARSSFGYVGDVGTLPTSLVDLVQNPGSHATWDGPYIETGTGGSDYAQDAWGVAYQLIDTLIRSTGSGSNIDKLFAPGSSYLLANTVAGNIRDAGGASPGTVYTDSVALILTYPNGTGGMATSSIAPKADGSFTFSSIPMGNHLLRVISIPDSDTVQMNICVTPGRTTHLDIIFPADLF